MNAYPGTARSRVHCMLTRRRIRGARLLLRSLLTSVLVMCLIGFPLVVNAASAGGQHGAGGAALEQTVTSDEKLVDGTAVIDAGHVDIGPKKIGDDFQLVLRDDTKAPPVWRSLKNTVLHVVNDGGKIALPDDPAYDFITAKPGEAIWLIPQVEKQGVVWAGWNSQDPDFVHTSTLGMTLQFYGMQGPGDMFLFLEDGFSQPQVLWNSTMDTSPQDIFVENNTHTHANWAFTKPGIYLLKVGISYKTAEGEQSTEQQILRIAVGDQVDPQKALSMEYESGDPSGAGDNSAPARGDSGGAQGEAEGASAAENSSQSGSSSNNIPLLMMALGIGVVLVIAVVVIGVSRMRTKKAAKQARAEAEHAPEAGG